MSLWETFSQKEVATEEWPCEQRLSALEVVRKMNAPEADNLEQQADFLFNFLDIPIIAVAGLKNAGKSSLVAGFLSEANRRRIPIGTENANATQRFVLWMPAAWQSNDKRISLLRKRLADVFKRAPIDLAQAPEQAIAQQLQVDEMAQPLLAFDENLDELQMGLVDCPDIETAAGESIETNPRLAMLACARQFCAAVMVVLDRPRIQVASVEAILRHLPEATRIYAVNMIDPTKDVRAVAKELIDRVDDFGRPEHLYGAFHYRYKGYEEAMSSYLPSDETENVSADEIPRFFNIEPDSTRGDRAATGKSSSILHIGSRLDPDTLLQAAHRESVEVFYKQMASALQKAMDHFQRVDVEVQKAASDMFDTVLRLIRDDKGNLKLKPDPAILDSLRESLVRTAPLWIKPMLKISNSAAIAIRRGKRISRLAWTWIRRQSINEAIITDRLRPDSQNVINNNQLARCLVSWASRQNGFATSSPKWKKKESWVPEATAIIDRFVKDEDSNLTDDEWDKFAGEFWSKSGKWKVGATAVGSLLLALAAAACLTIGPIPGGVIATYLMGNAFVGITLVELLGSLGLSGLAGTASVKWLQHGIEMNVCKQQVSNLYGIIADRVGLPPRVPNRTFPRRNEKIVPVKLNEAGYGVAELRWRQLSWRKQACKEVLETLSEQHA